mgnify:CR=1 FL=1|jgi:hypothetical protein
MISIKSSGGNNMGKINKYDGVTSVIELPLKTEKWQEDRINKKMKNIAAIYNAMLRYELDKLTCLKSSSEWQENERTISHIYDLTKPFETVKKKYDRIYEFKIKSAIKEQDESSDDVDKDKIKETFLAEKKELLETLEADRKAFEDEILQQIDMDAISKKAKAQTKKKSQSSDIYEDAVNNLLSKKKSELIEKTGKVMLKEAYGIKGELLKNAKFTQFGFASDVAMFTKHYITSIGANMASLTVANPMWVAFSEYFYGNGRRIKYKKPDSIDAIRTDGKSGIRLIFENEKYYLLISNSPYKKEKNGNVYTFKSCYGQANPIKIEVKMDDKEYNREMMNAKISGICIKRKLIRNRYRYYVQFSVRRHPYQKKDADGNLKHSVARGKVGVCIWRDVIGAYSSNGVKFFNLASGSEKYDKERGELSRKMDEILRMNNPDNFDEKGRIKKGKIVDGKRVRLTWVKSNLYKDLSMQYRELSRRFVENRTIEQNKIIYDLLTLGDEFYIYDGNYSTIKGNLEDKSIEEQKKKADRRRSIQTVAPYMFISKLNNKLAALGCDPVVKVNVSNDTYWYNHAKGRQDKDSFGANYMMLNSFESVNHTIYRAFLILYYESKTKQYVIPEEDWKLFLERTKNTSFLRARNE